MPVAVGKRPGSHFPTVQSMEKFMPVVDIDLQLADFPNEGLVLPWRAGLRS